MANKTALQLLPYIQPAQAQKHVTFNTAIQLLDVLVQTSAESRFLTVPPVGPSAGESYIVGLGASGDWAGEDNSVAVFNGSYWDFYEPKTGWRVWVQAEGAEAVWDGALWTTASDRPERVARLGVSTDADDTNRLSVASAASLFSHAGAGHQLKINKAAAGNTASILFQTNFGGRAEMGTVGNDDFVLKVSPDGTTFLNGLTIEAATGRLVAARGIKITPYAGDPATPENGDIWYNATSGKLRIRQGGSTVNLVDLAVGAEQSANKGQPSGYAGLDSSGKVPVAQLPSFVDLASAQTITGNKTFTGTVTFSGTQVSLDTGFTVRDTADQTKRARFEAQGIATNTTRVLNLPNTDGTLMVGEEDFASRADFVTWATGRTPSLGRVVRAAAHAWRYVGTGAAISDLPGWIPDGIASAVHFGADLTGSVSAVSAVSALIDYVNANGGGIARLPAGTYKWAGGIVKQGLSGVILEGEGNRTVLQRQGNQAAAGFRFWGGEGNRIRRIRFEANGYAGRGFLLQERFSGIEDCECNNCPDRPFAMSGGGDTTWGLDSAGRVSDDPAFTTATFFPFGCWLDGCRVTRTGSTAFSQKQMPHSRITRCYGQQVYSEGITIDKCDWSVVTGNMLLNVGLMAVDAFPNLDAGTGYLAVGGGGVGGVGIDGAIGSRFVKNTIIGVNTDITARNSRFKAAINVVNNIHVAQGLQIEGNFISDAKTGIWLKGTVSGATGNNFGHVLTGNVFELIGTATTGGSATYGAIYIDPGCTDNLVDDNTQIGGGLQVLGNVGSNVVDSVDCDVPYLVPVAGEYIMTTMGGGASLGSSAMAAGRCDLYPFVARTETVITGVAINVSAVATGQAKVVVYDADAFGRPGSLLLETGDMDTGTAGVRTVAASLTLRRGKTYWVGVRASAAPTLSTWPATATPDINGGAPSTLARKVVRRTLTYATAAPTTWGWSSAEGNSSNATAIWFKV